MGYKYTPEELMASAKKFSSKQAWAKGVWKHYQAAKTMGIFEACVAHTARPSKALKYADADILKAALTCTTRAEFRKRYPHLWNAAYRRKIYEEVTAHMLPAVDPYRDDMSVIYAAEFSDKRAYVGLTINLERRQKTHAWDGPIAAHAQASGLIPNFKVLESNLNAYTVSQAEAVWHNHYRTAGWILLNTAPAGSQGSVSMPPQHVQFPAGENRTVFLVCGPPGVEKIGLALEGDTYLVTRDDLRERSNARRAFSERATRQQKPIVLAISPGTDLLRVRRVNPDLIFRVFCVLESVDAARQRLQVQGCQIKSGVYVLMNKLTEIAAKSEFYGSLESVERRLRFELGLPGGVEEALPLAVTQPTSAAEMADQPSADGTLKGLDPEARMRVRRRVWNLGYQRRKALKLGRPDLVEVADKALSQLYTQYGVEQPQVQHRLLSAPPRSGYCRTYHSADVPLARKLSAQQKSWRKTLLERVRKARRYGRTDLVIKYLSVAHDQVIQGETFTPPWLGTDKAENWKRDGDQLA